MPIPYGLTQIVTQSAAKIDGSFRNVRTNVGEPNHFL
jgi:hypothetical protein